MTVPGECRDLWIVNPMQLELFGDNIAGEEFYHRLTKLMGQPERMKDVLEVYYLCLCLGFQGKYRLGNAAERDAVIENLARTLLKSGNRNVSGLSPHGRGRLSKDMFKQSNRRVIPLWVVGFLFTLLVGAWWGVMYYLSEQSVRQVLSILH